MLSINTKKVKSIEIDGKKVDLKVPTAIEQCDFEDKIQAVDKDNKKTLKVLLGHIVTMGLDKNTAELLSIQDLQDLISYVTGVEKK